jgi:hypothetical protein
MTDHYYNAPTSRGFRIAHDKDDIQEGTDVILTMKDEQILDNGRTLNLDSLDTLQNPEMAEDYKRSYLKKMNDRNTRGYDDPDEDALLKSKILSKYDELEPEKQGFMLDFDGEKEVAYRELANISDKLGIVNKYKNAQSLDVQKKVMTDYEDTSDILKIGKGFGKGRKRDSGRRKEKKNGNGDYSFLETLEKEVGGEGDGGNLGKRDYIRAALGNDAEVENQEKMDVG